MSRLETKQAIITGAASGIGRASARLFAERGAKLVLTDIQGEGLEETLSQIRAATPDARVSALQGDAADPAHVARLIALCADTYGAPNVFFANAGIGGMRGLMEETLDEWQRILRVNLLGPLVAIQAVAPVMASAGGGSIVLTASVAGLRSGAGSSAYSSSKAGVVSLAQTAACQLASQGIRVNAICPGLIETGMTKPLLDSARSAGKGDKIGKHNPMRRAAQPSEIATMAAFLASDDASFITGQALVVDGGMSATHPFTHGRVI
jgi:NAD(P)-dependent dehydrogenase (short-subunit alcohol dehydrogenase family)